MKKLVSRIVCALLASLLAGGVYAQEQNVVGSITTQNLTPTARPTDGSCVAIYMVNKGTVTATVTGTYTGALSGLVTNDGATWATLTNTSTFTDKAGTATATIASAATGPYQVLSAATGYQRFQICGLSAMTGTAVVTLQTGNAGGGGGGSSGGGGGAVTIADGADVALGTTTDAASAAGGAGTALAKLRLITTQLGTLDTSINATNTQFPATLGSKADAASLAVTQSTEDKAVLAAMSAKLPAALGAQAVGSSFSVVPATSSTFAVSSATLATAANQTAGSATAFSATTRVPVSLADGLVVAAASCSASCNSTTLWSTSLIGYQSIAVTISSIGGGATLSFQQSDDATFVVGTQTVACTWSNNTNQAPITSTTAVGIFLCPRIGNYFRVQFSAYTSGTVTSSGGLHSGVWAAPNTGVAVSNTVATSGTTTEGNGVANAPIQMAVEGRTTEKTAVATGSVVRPIATAGGKLVVVPGAIPEVTWVYAAATGGISNTITAVTMAAALASKRNYVRKCQLSSDALGVATELAIRDGAAGTVMYRMKLGTAGVLSYDIGFDPPLRGTANTLVEVVTLTESVTGGVFINCQGYTGD